MGQLCDSSIQKGGDSFRMYFMVSLTLIQRQIYNNIIDFPNADFAIKGEFHPGF